jgi:decaprenyl-phosphate phosphoribosyltransferase
MAAALVRTARPRQWVKNVLVFAAPGAAGVLFRAGTTARAVAAFALFSMAASGTYFLNDAVDHVADRLHPTKRHRPVAAGDVPVGLAKAVGACLLALSLPLALAVDPRLALALAVYVAVTFSYSLYLKNQPVLDMAAVASGFVIRAIAGGVATDVPLSNWFLIVASFGSLFMVAGKRQAEHLDLDEDRGAHRATLAHYSLAYLRSVRSVASGVTMTAYCLWAFEKAQTGHAATWFELSIVPFVIAILRYALLIDGGQGGAPEDVVLGDRTLQVIGAVWVLLFAIGVYAG